MRFVPLCIPSLPGPVLPGEHGSQTLFVILYLLFLDTFHCSVVSQLDLKTVKQGSSPSALGRITGLIVSRGKGRILSFLL